MVFRAGIGGGLLGQVTDVFPDVSDLFERARAAALGIATP